MEAAAIPTQRTVDGAAGLLQLGLVRVVGARASPGLAACRDAVLAFASIGFINPTERNYSLNTVAVPAYCRCKCPVQESSMAKRQVVEVRVAEIRAGKTASPTTPAGNAPAIDIGISGGDRKKIAEGLSRLPLRQLHPLPEDP